jgi:hypothetical protein
MTKVSLGATTCLASPIRATQAIQLGVILGLVCHHALQHHGLELVGLQLLLEGALVEMRIEHDSYKETLLDPLKLSSSSEGAGSDSAPEEDSLGLTEKSLSTRFLLRGLRGLSSSERGAISSSVNSS